MKKKVYLKPAQLAQMKEDIRVALRHPPKSRARGRMLGEIAERYFVSRATVWKTARHTRRRGAVRATSNSVRVAMPAPSGVTLTIGGVTISAPSMDELLAVIGRKS